MPSKLTAPRGTQDFIPPHTAQWHALEERIHSLAARFGYSEIRTPAFESTELFVRGVGETTDIVEKEMYTFVDKGGRSITLRPEWTAPVVRAALEHNLFSSGPQRLYYIGPIFRYERPQKGRYRQSHQFGVECTGYKGPEADVEVIALAWELVRSYGMDDAVLNINSIGDETCRPRYREALLAHFRPHVNELSDDSQRRLERNPLRLLDSKDPKDKPFVETAPTFESILCDACREHFDAVKAYLDAASIPYVVNSRIVRGLDYYTRTVFEITSSALGSQSTVCGGGRYDGLIASLGGPEIPAVGFGLGLERFLMMLEAMQPPAAPPRSGVQAIALGAQARSMLVPLAMQWRRTLGVPVFMDFDDRKIAAHFKAGDRNNARYAVILGSDELASGELIVRDLETRTESRLPLERAADLAGALSEGPG
ncbi:MAG TPA: histidine--tRNA ligase [Candidatus Baltobacteraceae bacterium]|nr:histidine--tRNA ligase [Candidatus Baltobacteraceae bacterium]